MIDALTNSEVFKGIATVITGGAFVGWYREKRRGKKDVYSFAIEMLGQQSTELAAERLRVDRMISDIAELRAERNLVADQLDRLRTENEELRTEVTRLKTALGEHGRTI